MITTKWVDTSKGDEANLDYRARLVGREIKTNQRFDLFVAALPFESLRMILSMCASNQHHVESFRILSSDVKRAYFFCSRDCHRLFGLSPERFSEKHETAPVDKEPSETAQPRSIKCEGA